MVRELGALAGGMDYSAVGDAVRLYERKRVDRLNLQRAWKQCVEIYRPLRVLKQIRPTMSPDGDMVDRPFIHDA